ncbi:DHA2 family efflux MFS transporter permease subunit [Jongsikchunia kroppenstedtii]|uniref:DHA2 family efflux MFS transporter permease subunit n=1 Tax=Jongsikchunia kroppenstedtii TaxID=1121721 RepID=UPI000475D2FE|nr:DHA2 family efflux MFS transporter permease subunit [Jongsikchunia kroppenstedtii]
MTAPTVAPLDRRTYMVAFAVVLGAIMSILDTTVVSVAQNEFAKAFDVTNPSTVAWTATGYTLALAAVIPISAWAANRFGTKRVYMASMLFFVIGSVLCALAWNIGSLVAFRMLQGLGGGMLMPVGMMILTRAAGPGRMGSLMAVLGIPMLLGPILGPILGGVLIEYLSWHWIFLINVPIAVVALAYAYFVLPSDNERVKAPFDFVGLLLLSPGLAIFLYGVSSSNDKGTFMDAKVLGCMAVGVVLVAGFIWRSLSAKTPLLDLHLLRNPKLAWSVVCMVTFMIAFFGAMLLYPQYFIGVRGESTVMAGLLVAPQGLGAMLTMPVAGRMTDKIGPGKFVLTGIGLITIGLGGFIWVGADTSYWLLCGLLFVQGLGMGMTMMPIMSAALSTLKPIEVPHGSTLMNVVQQVSGSIGTAIITVILTSAMKSRGVHEVSMAHSSSAASAFGIAFTVSAVLVLVTWIPAWFLPRTKPAAADSDQDVDAPQPVLMH